ncbi:hypothetical protein KP509_04G029900 [Ceratopteris richardii]|uniref:Uncharacterized protein n=1 Tax=Ceratopteris richardii TaxID=49495 RepID=A0A8T2V3F9_CERRI|nr:hypothetical protein KP509_04G029900 [Ceratopteris richardii]
MKEPDAFLALQSAPQLAERRLQAMKEPDAFLNTAVTEVSRSTFPPYSACSKQTLREIAEIEHVPIRAITAVSASAYRPPTFPLCSASSNDCVSQIRHRRPRAHYLRNRSMLDEYDRRLASIRYVALFVGCLYKVWTFLALCNLTWASVVLLGAFVDELQFADYAMVTFLLIFEAVRLASAAFFTILLTHGLARGSQNPESIKHGKDYHYPRALFTRTFSYLIQPVLVAPAVILPCFRFHDIRAYSNRNMYTSILGFYIVVVCSAVVSFVTLIISVVSFLRFRDPEDQGITRYYDELLQRTISVGVIQADDFEFVQFAYRMLGKEYARHTQPEAVLKNHKKLIEYLYHHRLGQDFLLTFMNDGDAFVQLAAVNMPGFWSSPIYMLDVAPAMFNKGVLEELANKTGFGQVGWAAITSFGMIAMTDPNVLMATRTSRGRSLLDRLTDSVDVRSSKSLSAVRALVRFYHYFYEKNPNEQLVLHIVENEQELVGKLRQLLRDVRVHRLRVYSAYLLYLLGSLDSFCYDAVGAITPMRDKYWFRTEFELLNFIRQKCGFALQPDSFPPGFLRDNSMTIDPHGSRYL